MIKSLWNYIFRLMNRIDNSPVQSRFYLDVEGSTLNLRRALLDDEWDAIRAVLRRLRKVDAKQLQSSLELFMAALDGERFQALLMAGQGALAKKTQTAVFKKSEQRLDEEISY